MNAFATTNFMTERQLIRENLIRVVGQMRLESVECRLRFDREVLLLPVGATACARGVAGHQLMSQVPDLSRRFFKPGQGGDAPPAFLMQPLHFSPIRSREFLFQIFSWEGTGGLQTMLDALKTSKGRPWGNTGARIIGFETSEPVCLQFSGTESGQVGSLRIRLATPLALRAHLRKPDSAIKGKTRKRFLKPPEITVGRLCHALLNRINNLLRFYGNGEQLDPKPFLAETALVRELQRDFSWVQASRSSAVQQRRVFISGVVGYLDIIDLPPVLQDLLSLGAVFHLGHRTADGCGLLSLEDLVG